MRRFSVFSLLAGVPFVCAATLQSYTWKNVKIGGGGGFVPSIVFNPSQKGLAYARTDIGGAYKLNADDSWTPLLDFVGNNNWNYWGVDALATDPVDPTRLYLVSLTFPEIQKFLTNTVLFRQRGCTRTAGIPIMGKF